MAIHMFDPQSKRLIKSDGTEIDFGNIGLGTHPDGVDLIETVREIALTRSWIGPHDEVGMFA